jgi:hypothetical protein
VNLAMTDSYREQLERRIWRTRGSRFNASRRIRRNKVFKNYAVTWVSAYVLALSVPDVARWAGLEDAPGLLIALAIVVFAASALLVNDDSDVRAHLLHACGKEMNPLLDEMQRLEQTDAAGVARVAQQYNSVVASYDVNHEPEDDRLFLAHNRKEFNVGGLEAAWARLWSFRHPVLYVALIVLPPLLVVLHGVRHSQRPLPSLEGSIADKPLSPASSKD